MGDGYYWLIQPHDVDIVEVIQGDVWFIGDDVPHKVDDVKTWPGRFIPVKHYQPDEDPLGPGDLNG